MQFTNSAPVGHESWQNTNFDYKMDRYASERNNTSRILYIRKRTKRSTSSPSPSVSIGVSWSSAFQTLHKNYSNITIALMLQVSIGRITEKTVSRPFTSIGTRPNRQART